MKYPRMGLGIRVAASGYAIIHPPLSLSTKAFEKILR
jgi:hypothetical protein